tara:strand:- start:595 stop:2418 length:1824 start_codon:yes stop_codon:yes gene_type:complete
MIVLGIHIETTSTAAIMVDGKVVACASEERFTRRKNDERYPKNAIDFCVEAAGINSSEIDIVAIASDQLLFSTWATRVYSTFSIKDHIRAQHEYWKPLIYEKKTPLWVDVFKDKIDLDQFPGTFNKLIELEKSYYGEEIWPLLKEDLHQGICKHLNIDSDRIVHVEHHSAHAAYAYWSSTFRDDETLVLTTDAWGDGLSATINIAKENKIQRVKSISSSDFKLARLYRYVTLILGMKPNEHEFKIMGLAPYANAYDIEGPYKVFSDTMYVDGTDFKWKTEPQDMYFYFKERLEGFRFDAIAGALQKYTEDILSLWVKNTIELTGIKRVAISGGISMNIKANQIISELSEVDDLFVGGSGSDESLAIGSCFHVMNNHYVSSKKSFKSWSSLNLTLGNSYSDSEIYKWIIQEELDKKYSVEFEIDADRIALALECGNVIGRMVGKMEFGARALGNRSIIADPRSNRVVEKLNKKIKSRDFWMPFAPSILEDACNRYVVNPKNLWSPFMTIGFNSTDLAREEIPAALHPSDYTLRPQMVRKTDNEKYYELIKAFEKRTGVGAVLNTSFNLHGSPIIKDFRDALYVFENSDLDMIILENTLVSKKRNKTIV